MQNLSTSVDNLDGKIKQTGCDDEKARHRVIEGSIFQHVVTKKCLSVNTSSEDLEQRIFLTEKCTNSSNRYLQFQDFPPVHGKFARYLYEIELELYMFILSSVVPKNVEGAYSFLYVVYKMNVSVVFLCIAPQN